MRFMTFANTINYFCDYLVCIVFQSTSALVISEKAHHLNLCNLTPKREDRVTVMCMDQVLKVESKICKYSKMKQPYSINYWKELQMVIVKTILRWIPFKSKTIRDIFHPKTFGSEKLFLHQSFLRILRVGVGSWMLLPDLRLLPAVTLLKWDWLFFPCFLSK